MRVKIEKGDVVFATGVYLERNPNIDGGWIVSNFEDDTYFEGDLVQVEESEDGLDLLYYIENDEVED